MSFSIEIISTHLELDRPDALLPKKHSTQSAAWWRCSDTLLSDYAQILAAVLTFVDAHRYHERPSYLLNANIDFVLDDILTVS